MNDRPQIREPITLYAWIGEDELGSGRIGLKQGFVPAGCIPLVAMSYDLAKMARLQPQMETQAQRCGKKIRLCKFVCADVVSETSAGTWPEEFTL